MTTFQNYQSALAAAVDADPVLRLAHAAAWLDPLMGVLDDEDIEAAAYGEDPDAAITMALHITRQNFPDIYIDTLFALRAGESYAVIESLVCTGLNQRGIPLEQLELLSWGIPLPAYGVELDDPDFYQTHPDTLPILACFGISPDPNPYRITIPEAAYQTAQVIADSLHEQPDPIWQQVAELIGWLFGICQNSSIWMTYENMCEVEPLGWNPDDIEFAIAIIEEADAIMDDAISALEFLTDNDAALHNLQTNVQKIYQTKGTKYDRSQLTWTCSDERHE